MITPTTAMQILCGKECDPNNLPWTELIEARMSQLVKPCLEIIPLPKLGDQELIWASGGQKKSVRNGYRPSDGRGCPYLEERGFFRMFAHPEPTNGKEATLYGWGFRRTGEWRLLTMTRPARSPEEIKSGDWIEEIESLETRLVELPELLDFMQGKLRANDENDAFRYADNDPVVIWNCLGKLIARWNKKCLGVYSRSQHFAQLIELEDVVLTAKTY